MEKMIILTVNRPLAPSLRRTPVSAAGGGARGVAAMGGGANAAKESAETLAEMKVESADLNASEQADLAHNPNVAAAARDMPIKLIEPAKRDTLAGGDVVATPCSVTPTWGIEAVGAASDDFTGAGVRVAVLDTGIDEDHDAFAGIPLSQFSGTNPNGNYRDFTGEGFADTDGHGTHCAGTIFGRDVNGNRIGVARGINDIVIAKVLGANGGDTAIMVEALHWAIQRQVNVISMSLGYDIPGLVDRIIGQTGLSPQAAMGFGLTVFHQNLNVFNALMLQIDAISSLSSFGAGTLVTAASGNESNAGVDKRHRLPASLPSASKGVVSVGALREKDDGRFAVADFSNGDVRIAAPGVDVVSARSGGGLVSFDGTSMATPHVAGLMARFFQAQVSGGRAGLTDRVEAQLIADADPERIDAHAQTEYGAGLAQSPKP